MRVTARKIQKMIGESAVTPRSTAIRLLGGIESEATKKMSFNRIVCHVRRVMKKMVRKGEYEQVPRMEGEKDFRYTPKTRVRLSAKTRRHNRHFR